MGNRLARSSKKRVDAAHKSAAAQRNADEATAPGVEGVSMSAAAAAASLASRSDSAEQNNVAPIVPAETTQPHLDVSINAVEAPVDEATERQRQQRGDPAFFFSYYDGSDRDAVATAVSLMRPLARRPLALALAADARVRLAQWLLPLDPMLRGTTAAMTEVEALLSECLRPDVDHELAQQAQELIAHVRLACGEIRDAAELLDVLSKALEVDMAYQLTSDPDETQAPLSHHARLLTVDAEALVVGPQ